jgi:hypothetical protein
VKTIAWAERRGSLLVSSVLGDIVPELDVAAGEDAALGPPHDDLAVGQHVLHRLHHLSGQLPLAAHAPHHLLVHLPRPERHLRSRLRGSRATTAAGCVERFWCLGLELDPGGSPIVAAELGFGCRVVAVSGPERHRPIHCQQNDQPAASPHHEENKYWYNYFISVTVQKFRVWCKLVTQLPNPMCKRLHQETTNNHKIAHNIIKKVNIALIMKF